MQQKYLTIRKPTCFSDWILWHSLRYFAMKFHLRSEAKRQEGVIVKAQIRQTHSVWLSLTLGCEGQKAGGGKKAMQIQGEVFWV